MSDFPGSSLKIPTLRWNRKEEICHPSSRGRAPESCDLVLEKVKAPPAMEGRAGAVVEVDTLCSAEWSVCV